MILLGLCFVFKANLAETDYCIDLEMEETKKNSFNIQFIHTCILLTYFLFF